MLRLWPLCMVCITAVLHADANNPIDWQTALLQAFILVTPITISMAVANHFVASTHLRPMHGFSVMWLAFMAGVLGYHAVFPLVFGGGWDFAGGIRMPRNALHVCHCRRRRGLVPANPSMAVAEGGNDFRK